MNTHLKLMLNREEIKRFYDSFGEKQDKQFYERAAIEALISHSDLGAAKHVVELGCGTGKFARKALDELLPADCEYFCLDISETMIALCRENTRPHSDRVSCVQTDGSLDLPPVANSADRFVSMYVLDLFSPSHTKLALDEAHRILQPGGLLCLAGLTHGATVLSSVVAKTWNLLFKLRPQLVGGCRPVRLSEHLDEGRWGILYDETIVSYAVPSEVLVAKRI